MHACPYLLNIKRAQREDELKLLHCFSSETKIAEVMPKRKHEDVKEQTKRKANLVTQPLEIFSRHTVQSADHSGRAVYRAGLKPIVF
jgi:hypothetical protein